MKVNVLYKIEQERRFCLAEKAVFLMCLTSILVFVACLQVSARAYTHEIKATKHTSSFKKAFNNVKKLTAPNKEIEGVVTDSATGEPLAGVSIMVKGGKAGTITDASGHFKLSVPEDAVLVISSIGYRGKEIETDSDSNIQISLSAVSTGLNQLVVTGYGTTQRKIDLTGAVDVVSGEALQNRSGPQVTDLLKGALPNLTINYSNNGGEPAASADWSIRGIGSLSGNAKPLILIDGAEGDPNSLNPQSIKSVTVLKDASAAAIYGSRAAFGVVLITTKKGEKGKARLSYDARVDFSQPIFVGDLYNSLIVATVYNQAAENSGNPPAYTPENMERIKGYLNGTYLPEYDTANPFKGPFDGRLMGNANYNYPKMLLAHPTVETQHTVSVSGGQENTQYYLSGGYYSQKGVYKYGQDSYERYNLIANLSTEINNWIRIKYGGRYTLSKIEYPMGDKGGGHGRFRYFRSAYTWQPMTPVYNWDGTMNSVLIASMKGSGRDVTTGNNLWLNLGAEIEPVKGWKTNANYHYNVQAIDNHQTKLPAVVPLPAGGTFNWGASNPGANNNKSAVNYFTFNATTSYERQMNKHYAKLLLGFEEELHRSDNLYAQRLGLLSTAIPHMNAATGDITMDTHAAHWATEAFFGRLNYNFNNKLLFQATGRIDGSSKFPEGHRWSFFPSFSAGYNIAQENFWQSIQPYVNSLKVRMSYGSLGNQNIPNYMYLPAIPIHANLDNFIINGAQPSWAGTPAIVSSGFTWETVTTINPGIDASFLKSRLDLSFDWFQRTTENMLGKSEDLPSTLGTEAPYENNAALRTKGVELTVQWRGRIGKDIAYHLRASYGNNTTRILKYYRNPNKNIDDWYIGKVYGEVWGYVTQGIIQTQDEADKMADQTKFYPTWGPGDIRYKDLNGDGVINDGNRTLDSLGDLVVLGNNQQGRGNVSFAGDISWKGLELSMFWIGVLDQGFYPPGHGGSTAPVFWGVVPGGGPGSESSMVQQSNSLDYWRPANETNILGPNTDAYFPKVYFDGDQFNKNHLVQSRYWQSAAYLRLKNVRLAYTIPHGISEKFFVNTLRVYFSAANVLTITSLNKAFDPETAYNNAQEYGSNYPLSRRLSLGINVTF